MENQKNPLKQIAINYGLLLALLSILILVITYVMNMDRNWTLSIVGMAITILLFVQAIKAYKHANGGFLKLGEALKVGLAVAAIAGVVSALYSYIHYSYIYPEYIDTILDEARMQMAEQNASMTDEQVNQALEFTKSFSSPFMMSTFALIGSLFFGFIISLITGLVLKRERPQQNF